MGTCVCEGVGVWAPGTRLLPCVLMLGCRAHDPTCALLSLNNAIMHMDVWLTRVASRRLEVQCRQHQVPRVRKRGAHRVIVRDAYSRVVFGRVCGRLCAWAVVRQHRDQQSSTDVCVSVCL